MRSCQVCGHNGKRVILNDYDTQPMCLFECTECGHRYLDFQDKERGQKWLDRYYLTRYRTDDREHSDARLDALADFISALSSEVLDIGGTDKELQRRLWDRKVVCNVGGIGYQYEPHDCVVLSHTLEHVYDIDSFFERVYCRLLVVEIPIHLEYIDPKAYDYHWQHVNKFRPSDIERLIEQKGYNVTYNEQVEDYREYKVWRIAGVNEGR